MNIFILSDNNGITFKRIDRRRAKKAFMSGLPVWACPCNLRPFGHWSPACDFIPTYYLEDYGYKRQELGGVFDLICNSFEAYNCINSETGRYISFYIPVCRVDFNGQKIPNTDYQYRYDDHNARYDYDALTDRVLADINKYFQEV